MTRFVVRGSEAAHFLMSARPCSVEALPWNVAPGMWPPPKRVRKQTYTIVGRASALAEASSRTRSADCTSCVAGKASERLGCPVWPCAQGNGAPQTISTASALRFTNRRAEATFFRRSIMLLPLRARGLCLHYHRETNTRNASCYSTARSQRLGRLLLVSLTLKVKFVRRRTQRFRNIFVGTEALEVERVEDGKHVQAYVEGCFWVVHQIADDDVIFAEVTVLGDEAKNFVGEAGH